MGAIVSFILSMPLFFSINAKVKESRTLSDIRMFAHVLFVHLCKVAHCTLLLIAMLVNLLIMEREALDFNDIAVFLGNLDLVVSLRVNRRFFIAYAI